MNTRRILAIFIAAAMCNIHHSIYCSADKLSFLVQRVQTEIWLVKDRKKYINVTFTTDNTFVKADSMHYYIGNTKNYLFYYDQDSSKTTVYPMSKITNISFKE